MKKKSIIDDLIKEIKGIRVSENKKTNLIVGWIWVIFFLIVVFLLNNMLNHN